MVDFIFKLADVGLHEVKVVGGKNASSGELIRNLSKAGIRVPQGFAVSAEAYRCLLSANQL
ncbi:MAG TPA: PEP/pyruvate-binding domain-containing protein, partial [Sphingomicrobium sp.]|nr:PEP/pyruvate-binding domain-containing protein [Sphingomicrobium sp.]